MKHLISIIVVALSICSFCETEIPESARIKVKILNCEIGEKLFYNVEGENFSFYAISATKEDAYFDEVAISYQDLYDWFSDLLTNISAPTAQKTQNLNIWQKYMTAVMAAGQIEQSIALQKYQDEKLRELEQDDSEGRQKISDEVTKISDQITANQLVYKLNNEAVNTKLTTLENQAIQEVTGLNAQLVNVNEELRLLDQKTTKTQSEINRISSLESSQRSLSVKINELKKAISTSQERSYNIVGVGGLPVSMETFSNNNVKVMTWMGLSTNQLWYISKAGYRRDANGVVIFLPKTLEKKTSGTDWKRYNIGSTYQDQLNEYGNIAYLSIDLTNKLHEAELKYPYSRRLYEEIEQTDDGPKTNVMATFKAPKNWVDGTTITCSNGVYKANIAGAIDFHGTDGSHAVAKNHVYFGAMEDSDVRVNVSTNANGVLIKFGVYWK